MFIVEFDPTLNKDYLILSYHDDVATYPCPHISVALAYLC